MRDWAHQGVWTCASRWMWLVVNLWDMSEATPFSFKSSWRWILEWPCGAAIFLREWHETRELNTRRRRRRRRGQQTHITRAYKKELTTGYRRLNLVVNLGNEVAIPLNFPFNQNHSSYGRDWSQIKGNSQLDTVNHFICNLPKINETCCTGNT